MKAIAADIGGTNARLVLIDRSVNPYTILFEQHYLSAQFADVFALLEQFRDDAGGFHEVGHLCLALPGLVRDGEARLTNLDWVMNDRVLAETFDIPRVTLLNDFAAAAEGVSTLTGDDYLVINDAIPLGHGTRVVTGPGTGLGLAWMQWQNGDYVPSSTEGGHTDFAPANRRQWELLSRLWQDYDHVSYERIVSGWGLVRLFRFCSESRSDELYTDVTPAEVDHMARCGHPAAIDTMDMFIEIFGAYVGNLCLLYKPAGGLFLAGGITAKLRDRIQNPRFLQAAMHKGRMRDLVADTPIYLVTSERLGLQGAMKVAARRG